MRLPSKRLRVVNMNKHLEHSQAYVAAGVHHVLPWAVPATAIEISAYTGEGAVSVPRITNPVGTDLAQEMTPCAIRPSSAST